MAGTFLAPLQGASEGGVRVAFPAHDPLRTVHEERRVAADPVPERFPHPAHGLRIHQANQDARSVLLAHGADPPREAQELRLHVLRVLVDLLGVDLPTDPRSLQERFAVGSVIEAGENRRHDLDKNRLHVPSPRTLQAAIAPLAWSSFSSASRSQPTYFCRPFTMNAG